MKKTYLATATTVWLIVATTVFFYIKYYYQLKTIGEIVVAMIPAMVFLTTAILIYARDKEKVYQAKRHEEFNVSLNLNWQMALIHDILIYLNPTAIIFLPIVFGEFPGLATFAQAIVTFLALSYLKIVYWKQL